ncbi:MAG: tRNA (N6-threonylcarbamoyladenosine(37)-N6)-methyltransferase TrmO [Bacteroidaceae bacterium]|nr:tRNA (N6-threonylcarbamoyladenosine(37)-N6)-methyltransferase TrmO [Bacteroidaceae bacterium]
MTPIAHIESPFGGKFGIPRQSGLARSVHSRIVFEKEFRNPEAFRGLEEFSHVWLLWQFNEAEGWSPTVRPPMLGGNRRIGVFATRSPFRPNHIGLSCVELLNVELDSKDGPVLHVAGADLKDGTPILDIKPYLPYTDSRPEARGGFTEQVLREFRPLEVVLPESMDDMDESLRQSLCELLSADPRPHYHDDPERIYGMTFAGREIRFRVAEGKAVVIDN